jgi:uncharacterized repeat protein (TIGR03803 family)
MPSKGRFPNVMFGASLRPQSAALAVMLALLFLIFITLTAQPAQGQTFKVIYTFTGGADGANPYAGLTMDAAGNLYGAAANGGDFKYCQQYGCGTIFKLTRKNSGWTLSRLYAFSYADGDGPNSKLVFGQDDSLYGATVSGGCCGGGTVFKLTQVSHSAPWKGTVLRSFMGRSDGAAPFGDILVDPTGWIYGATIIGGTGDNGTIYAVPESGGGGPLHSFTGPPNDGSNPQSGLILDQSGLLGATANGGLYQSGTIYELTPPSDTILYNFSYDGLSDGREPIGGMIVDQAGNLYGTTVTGGSGGGGTVFMLSRSYSGWVFDVLYSFTGYGGSKANLSMDADGNLYGATTFDGIYGNGNVFKLTRSGESWRYTSLHDFTGADGEQAQGTLLIAPNGNIYGTTVYGGTGCVDYGCGVIFEITP